MADEAELGIWRVTYSTSGYDRCYRFIAATSATEAVRRAREEFNAQQVMHARFHRSARWYKPEAIERLEAQEFAVFLPTTAGLNALLTPETALIGAGTLGFAAAVLGVMASEQTGNLVYAVLAAATLITAGLLVVSASVERLRQAIEYREDRPPPSKPPDDPS